MHRCRNTLVFLTLLAGTAVAQKSASGPTQTGWTGVLDEAEFAALHELKQGQKPRLFGEDIEVRDAKAYLSLPGNKKPDAAVLVIHEWWGLNDHIKHWTDRLAADGYAALAIDLYGGVVATTREGAMDAMRSVDEKEALATLLAAHRFLKNSPRVGAKRRACIGWCFGGGWSLKLAMAAPDLDAAVIYYGRLVTDKEKLAAIAAPILGVFGNQDRGIPPAAVDAFEQAMNAAGKNLRVRRYDANHAFANPSSARYSKEHAAAAWKETRAFLREHLVVRTGKFTAGGTEVRYVIPGAWEPAAARAMRAVNLTAGEGVECYVSVLGGHGGGLVANLNRWRVQMGQKERSAAELAKLPKLEMLGQEAPFFAVDGTYRGMGNRPVENARMLGTVCSLGGATVFVKMIGPRAAVAAQEDAFRAFCGSMKQ